MGALMRENCSGCGFEYDSGELFEHENGCDMVLRNRLEAATARAKAAERLLIAALDVIETPYYNWSREQSDACSEIREYVWAIKAASGVE